MAHGFNNNNKVKTMSQELELRRTSETRYGQSRTLVRGLRRLNEESREDFRKKVFLLRRQHEQFNINASEICQWLMGLRPGGKKGSDNTKSFWEFFLEPEKFLKEEERDNGDRYRRIIFDIAARLRTTHESSDNGLNQAIISSAELVRDIQATETAKKLFERMGRLRESHRQVLLKASAEWIVSKYLRGYENWVRQHEEWAKEKTEWEKNHPELAEELRKEFNGIFKELKIQKKNPRICEWEQLKGNKDNCKWAGERIRNIKKNHAALFLKSCKFFKD
jgi:hypothetical protein